MKRRASVCVRLIAFQGEPEVDALYLATGPCKAGPRLLIRFMVCIGSTDDEHDDGDNAQSVRYENLRRECCNETKVNNRWAMGGCANNLVREDSTMERSGQLKEWMCV